MLSFREINKLILRYFDPVNVVFGHKKLNSFRGDLADISAETRTLVVTRGLADRIVFSVG